MTKEQIQKLSERILEIFKQSDPAPIVLPPTPSALTKSELMHLIHDQLKTLKNKIK